MQYPETHSTSRPFPRRVGGPSRQKQNGGQTLVEMALIIPILVLLLFGLIEMGRLFFAWVTVQHAARTGTRFAVTGIGEADGSRLRQIHKAIQDACRTLPAGSIEVIIRSWHGPRHNQQLRVGHPGGPCDVVEVEVRYAHRAVVPLIGKLMPEPMLLSGSDRKMNEPWAPCGE